MLYLQSTNQQHSQQIIFKIYTNNCTKLELQHAHFELTTLHILVQSLTHFYTGPYTRMHWFNYTLMFYTCLLYYECTLTDETKSNFLKVKSQFVPSKQLYSTRPVTHDKPASKESDKILQHLNLFILMNQSNR